ncbi:protein-tyrosine phosphatase-like protein [Helicostylum pulchrum]|nr:protein-tyrosine phosphatase-like protein [Helicostylum pulchrum]
MTTKRLSLTISPSASTLANRRRNNKNLSLCLSDKSTPIEEKDDVNAYPSGPVQIMPYLYLGSEKNATDLDIIKNLSIGAILNVAAEVHHPYEYMFQPMQDLAPSPSLSKASTVSTASSIQTIQSVTSDISYQKLPWQHNQDNLVHELKKAIDIIDRARSAKQNILVHCQCGVARSATVIIAYVIKTLKLPMQDAYNHVKILAPPISPNLGLLFQLREFEQSCIQAPPPPPTPLPQQQQKQHQSRFLLRAPSLGAWKRKLSKSIFSPSNTTATVTATAVTAEDKPNWWKTRKLSTDTSACY